MGQWYGTHSFIHSFMPLLDLTLAECLLRWGSEIPRRLLEERRAQEGKGGGQAPLSPSLRSASARRSSDLLGGSRAPGLVRGTSHLVMHCAHLAASPRRGAPGLSKSAMSCPLNSLENTPRPTGTLAGDLTLIGLSRQVRRPYCVPGPGLGAGASRESRTLTQLGAPGLMAFSGEAV